MQTVDTVNQQQDRLLSRKEAAQYLGLAVQTLAGWACARKHDLPYVKLGKLAKYRKSDLEAFVARMAVTRGSVKRTNCLLGADAAVACHAVTT